MYFFTANEIHFICGGKYFKVPKCAKQFGIKIRLGCLSRNWFCTQAWKKGPSDLQNLIQSGWKFLAQLPPCGSKKVILCFLANMIYNIHKRGYLYRIHIYISVTAGKKDTKYLIKKSINQSACMNAKIERGKEEKVFSPNKDLGTRVGD